MKARILVVAGAFAVVATPTLAAEFYIVQDVKTKKCQIVSQKPTTKTTVVVGSNGSVYKTRTEAVNAMKTVEVCTSN